MRKRTEANGPVAVREGRSAGARQSRDPAASRLGILVKHRARQVVAAPVGERRPAVAVQVRVLGGGRRVGGDAAEDGRAEAPRRRVERADRGLGPRQGQDRHLADFGLFVVVISSRSNGHVGRDADVERPAGGGRVGPGHAQGGSRRRRWRWGER